MNKTESICILILYINVIFVDIDISFIITDSLSVSQPINFPVRTRSEISAEIISRECLCSASALPFVFRETILENFRFFSKNFKLF